MRGFDKQIPEFTVIFLHNPSECTKCSAADKLAKKTDGAGGSVTAYKKTIRRVNRNYQNFQTSTPVKNISIKSSKKVTLHDGGKKDLHFKNSPKSHASSASSPKKMKTKKKNLSPQTDKSFKKNSEAGKKAKNEDGGKSSSPKKKSNPKIFDDSKAPGKGTLKRKRWYFNKLNNSDSNYEDDIFENEKFGHFQNLLEDETDNCEQYEGLKTPVFPFGTSPRVQTPSPVFKECYSPAELNDSRKDAEEYQHRMNSRRKKCLFLENKKKEAPKTKTDKKKDSDVQKTLEEVARILHERQSMLDKSDSEDDDYFSDLFHASSTVVSQ